MSAGRGARGGAALALSTGLLGVATPAELEGIVAHELAHLRNRDVLTQTIAAVIAAAIVESSRIGGYFQRAFLFVLGPLAASFVHLLLSPNREYAADLYASSRAGRRTASLRASFAWRAQWGSSRSRRARQPSRSTRSIRSLTKIWQRSSSRTRRSASVCAALRARSRVAREATGSIVPRGAQDHAKAGPSSKPGAALP